ncbi:CDP-glycerol glycerophosphotransferase family protein [Butyrivibrio sp. YAB3001]|uniref:CDP-glycerol glycerophosphotransferase family protein n=1 Tax=Butyrivibrio sp. YAB3001 TaxID=1520812 RepID=UPI0008F63A56|nr:CDP-glycerol glycerophosphotransferase family protein [Butyrivibrio sp. YAB3001]SFC94535.1 CDP-glycerol glycerophosphotransferase [Butyrivibrio sp. YAB3001]
MINEQLYICWRLTKAFIQSIPFYLFRVVPINPDRIVFTTIEGTTGFTCNPKYIALEAIKLIVRDNKKYELIWLVDDTTKVFPEEIKKVKNTLINRAFYLSTAKFWIDNSRKQLECRKRKGQIYIQTWHAKLGFKPTCLDRGASFSRIAYLVSKHDSDMVDYWLSNSDWYDNTLKTGSLYEGKTLRTGSPRCDCLVKASKERELKDKIKTGLVERFGLYQDNTKSIDNVHFLMYAPTFRGGNQNIDRKLASDQHAPDYNLLLSSLEKRFGGTWFILLRLHPQMTVRGIKATDSKDLYSKKCIDVSKVDDMYEILAGCDAFMTDYSSSAFDAAVMNIPIFLYCDDYSDYENERGKLLWDLKKLPFPMATDTRQLQQVIEEFDENAYLASLKRLWEENKIIEDGKASKRVVDFIQSTN